MESNFRRALTISNNDPTIFVSSPITITLYTIVALFLALALFMARRRRPKSIDPSD
jgi:TctA family transporter